MKKIGLIGGLGPEATIEYYKSIIDLFNEKSSTLTYPEIIIYSVNMSEFIGLMKKQELEKATELLLDKLNSLIAAGADFGAITANTPHQLFNRLISRSSLPLISIVDATCRKAQSLKLKRPGLFGTGFTMKASFYQDVFNRHGIDVVVPRSDEIEFINQKLFDEIELGIFKDETRKMLIEIIQKMIQRQNIDSIILGCTELPLILPDESYAGIPMLNTTQIHVKEIVEKCLQED